METSRRRCHLQPATFDGSLDVLHRVTAFKMVLIKTRLGIALGLEYSDGHTGNPPVVVKLGAVMTI